MRLSRKALDAYNAAIKEQGGNAENAARKALEAWFQENPGASVAEAREFSIALMKEIGYLYGNAAGDAAYALRDAAAQAAGVELPAVEYEYFPEEEYVVKTAHYQAGKLDAGDVEGFKKGITDASRYFAERGANDTMAALGKADGKKLGKKVKFARVPTGATTCPFCLMLASRGFVYSSGLAALNANHRNCDCRIIEGFDGMDVEGYDPDEYYDAWKSLEKERFQSLYSKMRNEHGEETSGLAVLQTRDIKPHEIRAYHALMDAKFDFTVRGVSKEARARGHSSPDLILEGNIWELKCPDGANQKKTISRNINKAMRQMLDADPPVEDLRVVISCFETPLSDEQVLYQVDRVLEDTKENLVEVMVITKNNGVVRKTKQ